ncbi:MAG: glycoside hydrolase family 25 protein [Lachnospiraceae bacterium]|nr:glycoside hydrolase family 25 protein [Lachnospiraceae bacterium]
MSIRACALCVLLCAALALSGCGKKEEAVFTDPLPSAEDRTDATPEMPGLSGGAERVSFSTDSSPVGVSSDEQPSQPEILHFVDVFGEEYETEIDPEIPKHPYDLSLFQRDGQLLSYTDENFQSCSGIDVSHHQEKIDWEKVASQGFTFAILRIGFRGYGTEGNLGEDRQFKNNLEGARAAGLKTGVYFFAQAVNEDEAREEAAFVLELLNGEELDLPVVYDPESILDAPARTDNVTREQFTANSAAFCEIIREAGYEPMIYANMLWEAFELDLNKLQGIPIWYADYEPLPQTPYDFRIWQYSNEGQVDGVSGSCDLDILFQTRER